MNIAKFAKSNFYKTPPVAASANVVFDIFKKILPNIW